MNKKDYSIQMVNWSDHWNEIKSIRTQVFIIEQHVPEKLEWDGLDENAIHVIAVNKNKKPVGTGRLLPTGQIGRMAVLQNERNKGIGSDILKKLIKYASENLTSVLFLNAQLYAIDFYERHGFVRVGEIFEDANIPHCKMVHDSR